MTLYQTNVKVDASAGWVTVNLGVTLNIGQHLTIIPQTKNLKPRMATVSVSAYEADGGTASGAGATQTGLAVGTGETITLQAAGSWSYDNGLHYYGPDGLAGATPFDYRSPGDLRFVLLGKVGSGSWFPVSTGVTAYAPGTTGRLTLGMNDELANFLNNLGSVTATVKVNGQSLIIPSQPPDILVARIGTGPAFAVGTNYDGVLSSSGTLQLATNGLFIGTFTALVIVDAPDPCINYNCDCPIANCTTTTSNNPIDLRTGNKLESETDLTLQAPAGTLAFTRSYTQNQQTNPAYQFMGLGWSHNHAFKLTLTGTSPNRVATIRVASGGNLTLNEASGNPGHFDADAGSTSTLDYMQVGGVFKYILTAQDKSQYTFDATTLRLEKHVFPSNETWTYSYDGSGRLTTVDDGYGRQLQIVYISNPGQFNDGQLWRVGDQATTGLGTGSPTGRYVEYTYTTEKNNGVVIASPKALLSSVRDVNGNTWTYDYYGQHAGETTTAQLDFVTNRQSPSVDTTGDGIPDGAITIEGLSYTTSGLLLRALLSSAAAVCCKLPLPFKPTV